MVSGQVFPPVRQNEDEIERKFSSKKPTKQDLGHVSFASVLLLEKHKVLGEMFRISKIQNYRQ